MVLTGALLAGLGAGIRRLTAWRSAGSADTWPPVPLAPRDGTGSGTPAGG